MKNLILSLIILLVSFVEFSCTKLEEDPKGLLAPEGFFKTPSDVEAAINGAYAEWVTEEIEKSFLLALMLRSDMTDIGDRNTTGDRISVNDFNMDASNVMIGIGWTQLYKSISAANTAIKAAQNIEVADEIKFELEGKARFIRAYSYFHLVRSFGAVPYLNSPIESTEDLDAIIRTPESDVYDYIIKDLIFAKTHLPSKNTADVRNIGTKGSASAVLSEVYLTIGKFSEAAIEAKYLINNASEFNYGLEDNYQDLFNANLSGTLREPIFSLDLKNTLNFENYNPIEGMVNLTRIRDFAKRSLSVAVPSLKAYNSWSAKDYRKSVSFVDTVIFKGKTTALVNSTFRVKRPHIAKYFRFPGPQESGDDRSSDHHYSMIRYADVLLIAAEAIAESEGATAEAIGYINQIRRRARFNGLTVTEFPANVNVGISREDFIKVVREERRFELSFEFKRWYDIKRWGILDEAFAGINALETHAINLNRDYFFPIPQKEIDATGFPQNSGY